MYVYVFATRVRIGAGELENGANECLEEKRARIGNIYIQTS